MGLFDKVSGFVKREGEDIGAAADRARDRLDKELAEREAELEMTPSEKLRALQRKARENANRVDEIMEKAGVPETPVEPEAPAVDPADREPPQVTQIVLADGSVRRGDESMSEPEPDDDEADAGPPQGDLAWVAPRDGEEAIVPAFSASVGVAPPSSPKPAEAAPPAHQPQVESQPSQEAQPSQVAQPSQASPPAPGPEVVAEAAPSPSPEAPAEVASQAQAAPKPGTAPEPPAAVEPVESAEAEAAPPPPPPPPPPPRREPEAVAPAQPAAQEPPRRETPAEIAARVVAELEQAVNEEPEPLREPIPPPPQPEPTFEKTPAQRKYEEARKAADALLEELRGELKDDGEI